MTSVLSARRGAEQAEASLRAALRLS